MASAQTPEETLRGMATELQERSTWLVLLESVLFITMLLSTLLGNLMTVFVIYKDANLRSIPNYFIISLAVSDLGMATCSEPFCFTALALSRWPFGDAACQFNGFIVVALVAASIQTIAWMAVNRYYRIVKSSQYRRYFTSRSTKVILVTIWLLAVIAPCPYFMAGNKFIFMPSKFFCYQHVNSRYYTAFLIIGFLGFPTFVIFFCYLRIFQTVRKHNTNLQQSTNRVSAEEIKITRTLFVIVVLYMLCWTPVLVIDLIDTFRGRWSLSRSVYTAYSFLGTLSSLVNPFCYGIMNPSFRKGYLKVFAKVLCCRKYAGILVQSTGINSVDSADTRSIRIIPRLRSDDKVVINAKFSNNVIVIQQA